MHVCEDVALVNTILVDFLQDGHCKLTLNALTLTLEYTNVDKQA